MTAHNLSRLPARPAPALDAAADELAALPWMIRLTAVCFGATALGWALGAFGAPVWLAWLCYATAFASGGWFPLQDAWASLKAREFDVNFLMLVAALGAAAVGQPREGAILMFLFSLSNTLETYAMGRTHQAVQALLEMAPQEAALLGTEGERRVPVGELRMGDRVLVRPGERIPIDGLVLAGESAVDEAAITGESVPAEKRPGAAVFAGTLNAHGALELEVRAPAGDTTLARIVQTVEEARERKAHAQDFTDRVIGQYYAYAVVAMTALAIAIPLLFLGWDLKTTLYRAMALMVVASPCALVISIPAAVLSAMASAARRGILFKGGMHLEAAASIKAVALDKTGTLTTGEPAVALVEPLESDHRLGADELLRLAASVEALSEHPLARAVVRSARGRGLGLLPASGFKALAGVGAEATVGGRLVRVGRPSLFAGAAAERAHALEAEGRTVIVVGGEEPWGLIALEDTLRPGAREAVARLKAAGVARVALLTGDNRFVADRLARQLGVDEVHAGLLPEDKARLVAQLQREVGPVAMVGDGINDAPALATARLGVAMGAAGTDVALQSADMLLMSDDLLKLADALILGRRTRRVILQNLAFSFGVMAVLVVAALVGQVALPLGVAGHEGSTLLVVANGLRLLGGAKG